MACASGTPGSASAKPKPLASTTAPAEPTPGKASRLVSTDVAMRSTPAMRSLAPSAAPMSTWPPWGIGVP